MADELRCGEWIEVLFKKNRQDIDACSNRRAGAWVSGELVDSDDTTLLVGFRGESPPRLIRLRRSDENATWRRPPARSSRTGSGRGRGACA